MKFDWRLFFARTTESYRQITNKLLLGKKTIAKFFLGVVILAIASLLIEYFVFGYKLNIAENVQERVFVIEKGDVGVRDFSLDENGDFVSQAENASLLISTKGRYINNLEIDIPENPGNSVIVRYVDLESKKEIVLENRLQKSMLKNKLDFMKFLIFHIDDNPENISIEVQQPQTRISAIKFDNQYRFNPHRFLFVFAVGLLLWLPYLLRQRIGERPEYGFLMVSLICGSLLAFSETQSFVSWDEHIHYKSADTLTMKGLIRKDIEDIYARTTSVPHSYSLKEQKSIDEFLDSRMKKDVSGNKKSKKDNFSVKELYNKMGYFPSAAALMVGRILHLPYHIIFILGRLANVLVYSLVVFFAIRKLKSGKMLLATIALFPTSIFLASNYSYDFWVTSFTMLGLAYLFSELQQPEKKIAKMTVVIMLGAFVVGLGPKAIYFPIMALLFLLKPSKFKSPSDHKKFVWASLISIVLVLGSFLLPFVISGEGGGDTWGGAAVNSAEQVKFILTQPVAYAKILFNFMLDYVNPKNAGGFVTSFAYLGSISGFALTSLVLFLVAITDKNKFDKETSTLKMKAVMLGIYLFTVALICTALYVAFTAVGSRTIAGVQPRYLTPLVFPLLFVVGSGRIMNPFNKTIYNLIIFALMASVILWGVWDLIVKAYY